MNHQPTLEKEDLISGLEGFFGYLKRKLPSKGEYTRKLPPLTLYPALNMSGGIIIEPILTGLIIGESNFFRK